MRVFILFQKHQEGFTLTELLVALVVSLLTTSALITFFSFQTTSLRVQNARRAAQVTVRGALNFMVRELEHIGRDPGLTLFTTANPALQAAAAHSLHYRANLSTDWADTDDTDTWEDITFQYDASTRAVEITRGDTTYALTDSGERQKSYVPSGGLVFTYFKTDGTAVPPGSGATDRAKIRRINVSITVRGVPPDGYPEPEVTLSQDVILRNVP
jgi:prepilin-type N-terminal cleavage/methylation domain-containing protein